MTRSIAGEVEPGAAGAIRSLIGRYAWAVDARDLDAIADCFAADAVLEFRDTAQMTVGRPSIRTIYESTLAGSRDLAPPARSTHLMGAPDLWRDDDGVAGRTAATALLATPTTLVVRGLVYDDRFVETNVGWRFARRRHRCDWEHRVEGAATILR